MRINEYPDLDGLEEWATDLWEVTLEDFLEDQGLEVSPLNTELSEVLVVGQWGAGGAEIGTHDLELVHVFTEEPSENNQQLMANLLQTAEDHVRNNFPLIETLPTIPEGPDTEWFPDIVFETGPNFPVTEGGLLDFLKFEFNQQPGRDAVYSLTNREEIVVQSDKTLIDSTFGNELTEEEAEELPDIRINVVEDPTVIRQPVGGDIAEEPEQVFDDEEEEDEEDEIGAGGFEIEDKIDEEAGKVEVPSGKKQTTLVDYRPLYDFEKEMIAMGDGPTDLDIREGIGEYLANGEFGFSAPPITFPRTGQYVKHRLDKEGPAYVKMMHRDICRYSWGIIEEHQILTRPGLYENFRNMIFKLKEFGLIESIDYLEAQSQGLDVFPKTPGGREAPFLEPRNWYRIAEGTSLDDAAWSDVNEALYGES